MEIFSINTIFFNIGSYPLSYIELVGTLFYFISVILISRKNILTWPIGIISVVLYAIIFYQIHLYSDMLEQCYYFIISIIGWIAWNSKKKDNKPIETSWSNKKGIVLSISLTIICTILLSIFTMNFHKLFPVIFPEPASYPIFDALTTVMSFIAMYLITIRKNEGWLYWIIIDIIGIWLYWIKDVRFISIQYIFLLGMAIYGFIYWTKKGTVKQ